MPTLLNVSSRRYKNVRQIRVGNVLHHPHCGVLQATILREVQSTFAGLRWESHVGELSKDILVVDGRWRWLGARNFGQQLLAGLQPVAAQSRQVKSVWHLNGNVKLEAGPVLAHSEFFQMNEKVVWETG